jgi:hypothetical protein
MAAERYFGRADLKLAAVGAIAGLTAMVVAVAPPAWSDSVGEPSVIVDLSVLDEVAPANRGRDTFVVGGTGSGVLMPAPIAPTSRLYLQPLDDGAAADPGIRAERAYGHLVAEWPLASGLSSRPLAGRAGPVLAASQPVPRAISPSKQGARSHAAGRLFPPPRVLAASAAPGGSTPARRSAMPPPGPATSMFPPPEPVVAAVLAESAGPDAVAESARASFQPARRPGLTRHGAGSGDARGDVEVAVQLAVLEPVRPPTKPESTSSLRPTAKPQKRSGLGRTLQLVYVVHEVDIPGTARPRLEDLARAVRPKDGLRLQLAAYAGGDGGSASKARRTSLSRALAIRSFLIDHGIKAGRIDVRALGNTSTSGEAERVDVVVIDK